VPSPTTPAPTTVTVAIESDPSGAEVFEGARLLGRTPLRETWSSADPAMEHVLTLRAPGFEPETVRGVGPAIVHAVRLRPLATIDAGAAPPERVRVRAPRPRGTAPGPAETAPAGYRNNVY
jgi:hypothetical protein